MVRPCVRAASAARVYDRRDDRRRLLGELEERRRVQAVRSLRAREADALRPDDARDDVARVDADAQVHGQPEALAEELHLLEEAHGEAEHALEAVARGLGEGSGRRRLDDAADDNVRVADLPVRGKIASCSTVEGPQACERTVSTFHSPASSTSSS